MKQPYSKFQIDAPLNREQNEALLRVQHDILEQLVLGTDSQSILDALCLQAEKLAERSMASIMLYGPDEKSLQVIAAPSVPEQVKAQLADLIVGPESGSCGTAVFTGKPQYVSNTQTDRRWKNFIQFVEDFNILSCWSNPIWINDDKPVGSFALSNTEIASPDSFQKCLLQTCAYVAGIVIKRQQEEKQLRKMAYFDPLTNLRNRCFFNSHLEYSIHIAQGTQRSFALLFIDIDKFKDLNDSQGHEAGDQLLRYIAENIKPCLRKEDLFARIGGDEFVILLENVSEPEPINNICKKICHSIGTQYTINNVNFPLSLSIGISIYPEHGDNAEVLLRNADIAMYEAKKKQSCCFFYDEKLTKALSHRLEMTDAIRNGLQNKEFDVFYQPQYDVHNGTIQGVEALLRWQIPEKGMINPSEFIPVAEHAGLINDLGIYVLKKACLQCVQWWEVDKIQPFSLAINVSAGQLYDGFADQVIATIDSIGFPAARLELEITESLLMQQENLQELYSLKKQGISIAIDDFGTGYSSLSQLKNLPISKLKIDRSFVKDIPEDQDDVIIVSTIINMGQNLGLKVIAEGVETLQQKTFLCQKGCYLMQGFLLSKPLPAHKLIPLIM